MAARRAHVHLARKHDLLELSGANLGNGAVHCSLVMLGRHRTLDRHIGRWVRVPQGQRGLRIQRTQARVSLPQQVFDSVVRLHKGSHRQPHLIAVAHDRELGHVERRAAKATPVVGARRTRSERESADGDRAAAARAVRRVAERGRRHASPLRRHGGERAPDLQQ